MISLPIPPDVARVLPLLLALFAPTVLWTKYAVQISKFPLDALKTEPAHSSVIRLYTLMVGAVSLTAIAVFFGEPVSGGTWRALAATLVLGAAAGGAAMADYHLIDVLRSFLPPGVQMMLASGEHSAEPPVVPPAPPTT